MPPTTSTWGPWKEALLIALSGIAILLFLALGLAFAMMIAFPEDAVDWLAGGLD